MVPAKGVSLSHSGVDTDTPGASPPEAAIASLSGGAGLRPKICLVASNEISCKGPVEACFLLYGFAFAFSSDLLNPIRAFSDPWCETCLR